MNLKDAKTCTKCGLCETRNQAVLYRGSPSAKIMIIGEAPGAEEDNLGYPFVGKSGKLLDNIFKSQGISTVDNCYICNVVKCRPPGNRAPTQGEIAACKPYLDLQISLVNPKIIVLVGGTAAHAILGPCRGITKIRGQWYTDPYKRHYIPILHPSYLLRQAPKNLKDRFREGSVWDLMNKDVKAIRKRYEELCLVKV